MEDIRYVCPSQVPAPMSNAEVQGQFIVAEEGSHCLALALRHNTQQLCNLQPTLQSSNCEQILKHTVFSQPSAWNILSAPL